MSAFDNVTVRIARTRLGFVEVYRMCAFTEDGALLVTHWEAHVARRFILTIPAWLGELAVRGH